VVIQYRLGLFGFLAGAKVKSGGALNAGLREFLSWAKDNKLSLAIVDQAFALEWVQNHVCISPVVP